MVIDASSVGRSSDVLRLNKLANNVLFVVRYDATPLPALQDAIEKLDKSGVRVLGCVVNETQSLGTFQFYPERTAVSNAPKRTKIRTKRNWRLAAGRSASPGGRSGEGR